MEKMKDAYCPQAEKKENGVLEYLRYLLFPILEGESKTFEIKRPEKFGGNISFDTYKELEDAYLSDDIHPLDLKKAAGTYLVDILQPVRDGVPKHIIDAAYPNS